MSLGTSQNTEREGTGHYILDNFCGTNDIGYTNYPNNVFHKFCKKYYKYGVDVFCFFYSLNCTENLKLGVDAVVSAGGILEGTLSYTGGGLLDPNNGKYDLDY